MLESDTGQRMIQYRQPTWLVRPRASQTCSDEARWVHTNRTGILLRADGSIGPMARGERISTLFGDQTTWAQGGTWYCRVLLNAITGEQGVRLVNRNRCLLARAELQPFDGRSAG